MESKNALLTEKVKNLNEEITKKKLTLEKMKEDLFLATIKCQKVAFSEADYKIPVEFMDKPIYLPSVKVMSDLSTNNEDVLYLNKVIVRNFALLETISVEKWVKQVNDILTNYLVEKYGEYIRYISF